MFQKQFALIVPKKITCKITYKTSEFQQFNRRKKNESLPSYRKPK